MFLLMLLLSFLSWMKVSFFKGIKMQYVELSYEERLNLINETQSIGSANNWNILDMLLYLIQRVEKITERKLNNI